ncbi:MAG: hypothetical protein LBU60_01590 [Clostridiales bacterium]|jgi:hypothetical protein|nr:hypothetical protein [Clostridiales bacterium]
MVKKLSLIMSVVLLIVTMSTLTACVKNDKSLHDIWDMKLSSDGQTIEVFGLTSKGEKQAQEGNGVFDFPTEVNGKTKFHFKAIVGYMGVMNWRRYEKITGIIFGNNFQSAELSFDIPDRNGLMPVWLMFESKQNQPLTKDITAQKGIICRQNIKSDFDTTDMLNDDEWYSNGIWIFKDNILDDGVIVIDGVYYGQIFDDETETNELIVPEGVSSIVRADVGIQINNLMYGRYAPLIEVIKVKSPIEKIQRNNVLSSGYTPQLKKVYIDRNTVVEKNAFSSGIKILDIETGEEITLNNK